MKFLVGSDFHFSDTRPRCRVDDWYETQRKKASWVVSQMNIYACPLYIAGDIFDAGKVSPYLTSMMIEIFSKAEHPIYTIAGNHDMPYHNMNHLHQSSYNVMMKSGIFRTSPDITSFNFGEEITNGGGICMAHVPVFEDHVPPYMPDAYHAIELLDSYDYTIWLTGDIHQRFFKVYNGKILLNPGGLLRLEATEKHRQTGLLLFDTDTYDLEFIDVPMDIEAVQQEYLEEEHARDERMIAYVTQMRQSQSITLDYKKNLQKVMGINQTNEDVRYIINQAIEGALV